ncbi:MAG: T9SS type A sorting domain-containing protein [Lewinellaceae bacterium]|nr:T9SS type A sorting domain-containing protein [Lewinellaceae bacterium]
MFRYFLVLTLLLPAGLLMGQGWERVFDGGGQGQINDIAIAPDGGFIAVGYYNSLNRARLFKTDVDGNLQWTKDFFLGSQTTGEGIVVTQDGHYVFTGYAKTGNGPRQAFLVKTDKSGNTAWTYVLPGGFDTEALDIIELNDKGLVVCGHQKTLSASEDILVFKVSPAGTLVWSKLFGDQAVSEKAFGLASGPGDRILVAGSKKTVPRDMCVLSIDGADGLLQWENTFGFFELLSGSPADDVARGIWVTNDNNIVLAGRSTYKQPAEGVLMKIDGSGSNQILWFQSYPKSDFYGLVPSPTGGFFVTGTKSTEQSEDVYIIRTNSAGEKICDLLVGRPGFDQGISVVATPDGGAVTAGVGEFFFPTFGTEANPYLVKMDKNCTAFTSYVAGNVFHDLNGDCLRDGNESGLENWIVKIESPNFTRYAVAKTNGDFLLLVDTGMYQIKLFPPNDSWQSCSPATALHVTGFLDTFSVEIPVRAASACPRNEVDVATPVLRRCANNTYTVRYCNSGTIPSTDTKIEIVLDPLLTLTSSSIPATLLPGNTYSFDIGTLENGDCGNFTFDAFLDCNNTIDGQTHCVQAHIYPDSFCMVTAWDRSIVEARALCENDTVKMVLVNVGDGDMQEEVGFVIAEDVILLTQPGDPLYQFKLKSGQDSTVWTYPATGSTYRIIAEQTSGYPGVSYPTAAVEGCKSDTSSTFTTGYYTMFPEDDQNPFRSSDCQENNHADFNPENLKRGHPKGYDVAHYVRPDTDLEFLIQFQNTGTDTVHQVIVRDTLSFSLDPATVRPGTASHPYDFEVYGPGIVQFTIPGINLLPDSGANEGFVKFRVSLQGGIPCETQIFNSAAIYFDFEAPVVTNQTFHTVCAFDTFVVVKTKHIDFEGADVKVYPNPFDDSAVFEISGAPASGYTLELYDMQGRKLFNQSYSHSTFRLHRQQLPAGMLLYRLTTDRGRPVASGKLLVR